jgi:RecB family endonuclease NucS
LPNGITLDLFVQDTETDELIVVELKRREAAVEVVAQIEGYMKAVSKMLYQPIKEIICLHEPSAEIKELVSNKPDIELQTYSFDFQILA